MNDLEVFRSARPTVTPLDEATADAIRRAVFGVSQHTAPTPRRWRRVMAMAACAATVAAVSVVVASWRHTDAPTIAPATMTGGVATSTSSQLAATTSVAAVEDWRLHPERRFQRSTEYGELFAAALDSATGRCMVALGFEYVGNSYDSDSEIPPTRAPGSYEAAFLGESDAGGGCRQSAINSMAGTTTADAYANNMVNEMAGTWERTALADPSLQARLGELASCARAHGAVVRDTPDRLNKVFDDVQRGIETILISDERLMAAENVNAQDIGSRQALYLQLADELCPGYSTFDVDLDEANRRAQVAWVEANPTEMAKIQAEFDADMARFRYIIDHGGQLPPA